MLSEIKNTKGCTLFVMCALVVSSVSAMEFKVVGSKANAMGGVGVASSISAFATHYNPALLARNKSSFEMDVDVGVSVQDMNLVDQMDTLNKLNISDTFDEISANAPKEDGTGKKDNSLATRNKVTKLQNTLKKIDEDERILVSPQANILFATGDFAFGITQGVDSAVNMIVDNTRLDIMSKEEGNNFANDPDDVYYARYDQVTDKYVLYTTDDKYKSSSVEYAMDNGYTYVKEETFSLLEVPLSYGHGFNFSKIGELDVGATLKFMQGSYYEVKSNPKDGTDKLFQNSSEDSVSSSTFGLDLGLAFSPSQLSDLTVGLVVKNLNSPTFQTNNEDIVAEPMARIGFAYRAFDMLELALDYDITKNKQVITGVEKQYLGLGTSFEPASWFHLRAGYMEDIASNVSGSIITGGVGIGPEEFMLDISAQYSQDTFTFDNSDYPEYSRVNISIISKW